MKLIILYLLIAVIGWQGYKHYNERKLAARAASQEEPWSPSPPGQSQGVVSTSFRCDGRTHCSQRTSCAEATYFLKNCPGTKMDGNNDGVPCEQQWCH